MSVKDYRQGVPMTPERQLYDAYETSLNASETSMLCLERQFKNNRPKQHVLKTF
ncbi:unnamed protein product [Acanthoscelides obtectus]|uniref:Uncharacterized protein n=1 Tax=Acanthoscelides obtectus TaxID=200917 RepID=A0A9P0QAL4_ACAOB|nr:unnamed protein product [Acanthoscelides obtectus]CAK1671591.1 hypothetical protein AOBTE_LOCUS28346 [Acanthoscelides obtectus]